MKSIVYKGRTYILVEQVNAGFKTVEKSFIDSGENQEDVEKFIQLFKKARDKNQIKELNFSDINFWNNKDFKDFKDFVNKATKESTNSTTRRIAKDEGAKLVNKDDLWLVYKITSHKAAMLYGKGTKWCITQKDSLNWDLYTKKSTFYFILSKKKRDDEFNKIAAQVKDDGIIYWDEKNYHHKSLPFDIPKF